MQIQYKFNKFLQKTQKNSQNPIEQLGKQILKFNFLSENSNKNVVTNPSQYIIKTPYEQIATQYNQNPKTINSNPFIDPYILQYRKNLFKNQQLHQKIQQNYPRQKLHQKYSQNFENQQARTQAALKARQLQKQQLQAKLETINTQKLGVLIENDPLTKFFYEKSLSTFYISMLYVGLMAHFFTGFSYPYIFSICGQALSSSSIVALYLLPKNVIQDPVSSFPVVETTGPRAVAYVLGTLGISWQFLPGLEYLDTGDILINGALTFSYWKISQLIAMNFRYKNLPATNVFLSGMIVTLFFTSQAKIIPWVLVSSLFCSTIKDDFYQANPDYLFYSLLCMIVVINIYNQQFFQVIEWTKQEEVENQIIENQENNEQQILKQNELKEQEKVIENGKNKENQKQQYEEENNKTKQTNKNQLNNTTPPSKKSDS